MHRALMKVPEGKPVCGTQHPDPAHDDLVCSRAPHRGGHHCYVSESGRVATWPDLTPDGHPVRRGHLTRLAGAVTENVEAA